MTMTMAEVGFTPTLVKRLAELGIETTDDVLDKTDEELLKIRGMGVSRVELLRIKAGQRPPVHVKEETTEHVPLVEENAPVVFTDHEGRRFQARAISQDKETGAMSLYYHGRTAAIRTIQHGIPYKLPGEFWGWCLLDGNYQAAAEGVSV